MSKLPERVQELVAQAGRDRVKEIHGVLESFHRHVFNARGAVELYLVQGGLILPNYWTAERISRVRNVWEDLGNPADDFYDGHPAFVQWHMR